jgi:hypothetical protein
MRKSERGHSGATMRDTFAIVRFQQRRLWNAHIDVVVIRYNRDDAELRHDVQRPTASVLRLLRKELQ